MMKVTWFLILALPALVAAREERLTGPGTAGTMLADIARELIARSGTSSQVRLVPKSHRQLIILCIAIIILYIEGQISFVVNVRE